MLLLSIPAGSREKAADVVFNFVGADSCVWVHASMAVYDQHFGRGNFRLN